MPVLNFDTLTSEQRQRMVDAVANRAIKELAGDSLLSALVYGGPPVEQGAVVQAGTAGAALTMGDALYMASDGTWRKADGNVSAAAERMTIDAEYEVVS